MRDRFSREQTIRKRSLYMNYRIVLVRVRIYPDRIQQNTPASEPAGHWSGGQVLTAVKLHFGGEILLCEVRVIRQLPDDRTLSSQYH